jgi:hypothetical protein
MSPLGKHITKLIFTILSGVAEMQLAMIRFSGSLLLFPAAC